MNKPQFVFCARAVRGQGRFVLAPAGLLADQACPAPAGETERGEDPMESGRVLFVDDDQNALESFKRLLHGTFQVETALDSNQAFAAIQVFGPFEVIISDMKMPGMDGAEFLAKVRHLAPNSVRMVLSGHKDIDRAIEAVNEGRIFRYLTKPCEKDELIRAIELALAHYRTRTEDKKLAKQAKAIKSQVDSLSNVLHSHDGQ
jgi:DNA-binding NtrC family response regulator